MYKHVCTNSLTRVVNVIKETKGIAALSNTRIVSLLHVAVSFIIKSY